MRRILYTAIILLNLILTACTDVTVRRVITGNESGIRYFLPQPVLSVTPLEDGSLDVRPVILADRNETYAMEATSYLATHKVIMKLNKGLLTEVTLNQDSSAVAAEGVKAAGEIAKTKIETETAARTEAQKKEEEASQKRKDELKKLEDSLAQAEIEQDQAIAARDALLSDASSADKQTAAVAVAKAEAKVKALKTQLDADRSKFDSFNIVEKAESRPGPVLYVIKEKSCGSKKEDPTCEPLFQLVPLNFDGNHQKTYNIYKIPDSAKPPAGKEDKAPEKIEFEDSSLEDIQVGNSPVKVIVKTKTELSDLRAARITGSHGTLDINQLPTVERKNSKTFELQFKPQTPPDQYTIYFIGKVKESSPNIPGQLVVKVIP